MAQITFDRSEAHLQIEIRANIGKNYNETFPAKF